MRKSGPISAGKNIRVPGRDGVVDWLREVCLGLPLAREGLHYGDITFYVRNRIFASCSTKHDELRLIVQLKPSHAERVLSADPRFSRYPRTRSVVSIAASAVEDWNEMSEMIKESYKENE